MLKDFIRKLVKGTFAARTSGGEFLLKKTNYGLVHAEFAVVQKISERALRSVAGIHDSQLVVEKFSKENPVKIRLTLTLNEKFSAPKISEAADKAINNDLRKILGVEFYVPVDVKVEEIAPVQVKKRRVR